MVPTTTLGERMGTCEIPRNGKLLQPFFIGGSLGTKNASADRFRSMLRLSPHEAKLWASFASTAAFLVNINTHVNIACLRTPRVRNTRFQHNLTHFN